jgi:hypothetical protein
MKPSKLSIALLQLAQRASVRRGRSLAMLLLVVSMGVVGWLPGPTVSHPAAAYLGPEPAPPGSDQVASAASGAPVLFVENVGQFDARAHFQAHSGNTTLIAAGDALWVTVMKRAPQAAPGWETEQLVAGEPPGSEDGDSRVTLKLSFVGANPAARLEPFDRHATQVSFFTGSDPAGWHTGVPAWGGVRYVDLYPGLDWEITGQDGRLVQRLVAGDAASLASVRLRVEGVDDLALHEDGLVTGGLVLPLPILEGATSQAQPTLSNVGHGVYEVSAPFASSAAHAGPYDQDLAPPPGSMRYEPEARYSQYELMVSTYLGGSCQEAYDQRDDITVDEAGNIYITGVTASLDFPTTPGAYDTTYNDCSHNCVVGDYTGGDVFVTKLSADGRLVYSTYLGGELHDAGAAIVVDDKGQVYITGATFSTNFPTTGNVLDRELSGGRDAFVVKLNAAGDRILSSSYLGGNTWEYGNAIALDDAGNIYVGGFTHGGFPITPGAAQATFGGVGDGFIAKLNSDATLLLYSTYLGGMTWDTINGIRVDATGNVYAAGNTQSSNFPTTPGVVQPNFRGPGDGVVAKLNADGSQFVYSTCLGGTGSDPVIDDLYDIAIDEAGNAYVVGRTSTADFPTTPGALQTGFAGGARDVVVVKLNSDATQLLYSTYLGGSGTDDGFDIAIDRRGRAYVTGRTTSTDFPMLNPIQATNAGGYDAFVASLDANGQSLRFASYLGGSGNENWLGSEPHRIAGHIAVDQAGSVYLTGSTNSTDFPTSLDALQPTFGGGSHDAFVVKLKDSSASSRLNLPIILREYGQ